MAERIIDHDIKPAWVTKGQGIDLTGKIAIVTGSSRGIGEAIAGKLAYHGATLGLHSTDSGRPRALEVLSEVLLFSPESFLVTGDVKDPQTAKRLVGEAWARFKRLDILVNNAGITDDNAFARMSDEQWRLTLETNLFGAFFMTREAVGKMSIQRPRGGAVVSVSSISARGGPGQANYAASKGGIESLMRSNAVELASRNIRFNSVACGLAETDLTRGLTSEQRAAILALSPMGREIRLEEIADTVLFLASDRASAITGQTINVDGGTVR